MKLTGNKYLVSVLLLTFLLSLARGDVEVSCVFMESCILPCSFQPGPDPVIHWIHETPGNTPVHSFYHNQDQLTAQGQHFKNRTSLFRDQISRGNASLQLTGVKVQDEGRYQCYTSTESAALSFINLKVNAPVSKVDIKQEGNRITCSSEGIYPEPELSWSINPPSNVTFKNSTTVHQTEQQLYRINSSLIVSDSVTGLDYSCTVSTDRSRQRRDIFWQSQTPSNVGTIVGAVVAILALGAIIGLLVYCRQRKKQKAKKTPSGSSSPTSSTADPQSELVDLAESSKTGGGQIKQEPDEAMSLSTGD